MHTWSDSRIVFFFSFDELSVLYAGRSELKRDNTVLHCGMPQDRMLQNKKYRTSWQEPCGTVSYQVMPHAVNAYVACHKVALVACRKVPHNGMLQSRTVLPRV